MAIKVGSKALSKEEVTANDHGYTAIAVDDAYATDPETLGVRGGKGVGKGKKVVDFKRL